MVELVAFVIGLAISYLCIMVVGSAILTIIVAIGEFLETAWNRMNSVGKAVFFGIPMLIATYFISTFVIYTAIPYILHEPVAKVIALLLLGVGTYVGCYVIGWTSYNHDISFKYKNNGVIPFIARIIVLLPFMPVIYPAFYIKQVFCLCFISDCEISWNPHFITHKNYFGNNSSVTYTPKALFTEEIQYSKCTAYETAMKAANETLQRYEQFIKDNYKM